MIRDAERGREKQKGLESVDGTVGPPATHPVLSESVIATARNSSCDKFAACDPATPTYSRLIAARRCRYLGTIYGDAPGIGRSVSSLSGVPEWMQSGYDCDIEMAGPDAVRPITVFVAKVDPRPDRKTAPT